MRQPDSRATGALVAAAALSVLACLVGLGLTGQLDSQRLLDQGAFVRFGLPVVRVVHDLSAAVTIGLLVLVVTATSDPSRDRWALTGFRRQAVRWAGVAAGVWSVTVVVLLVFTTSDVAGLPLDAPGFSMQVEFFALHLELGQIMLVELLAVVVSLHLAVLATRLTTAGWAAVWAVGALLPLALGGHASGSNDHMNAVNSLAAHLLGVTVWVGGVIALLLLRPAVRRIDLVARRFSTIAGWCFAIVALSGIDSAWLRLAGIRGLATGYGALVIAKTVTLVALGVAGWMHRYRLLPRLDRNPRDGQAFARLLGGEILMMGLATGAAVALSRSAPPVAQEATGPDAGYRELVGFVPPPPLSFGSLFTQWYIDWVLLAGCLLLAGIYLAWVWRLRRCGHAWTWWRTACWVAGSLVLAWLTSGGPLVYGMISFSGHMLMHMLLMLGAPPLLVLGAPITLALRALPARADASTGPREWLLAIVHSRVNRVIVNPVVAGVLFSGSLVVFYATDLFPLAMSTHTGHMLMTFHFVLVGFLFGWSLVGIDPGAHRAPYPVRLVVLLATMAVHSFFSVSLLSGTRVLAPQWWPQLGLTDKGALLADQRTGAAIAWATGDIPTSLLLIGVAVLWARSSEREGRRFDRQVDRDGDAELAAYNQHLVQLANSTDTPARTPS